MLLRWFCFFAESSSNCLDWSIVLARRFCLDCADEKIPLSASTFNYTKIGEQTKYYLVCHWTFSIVNCGWLGFEESNQTIKFSTALLVLCRGGSSCRLCSFRWSGGGSLLISFCYGVGQGPYCWLCYRFLLLWFHVVKFTVAGGTWRSVIMDWVGNA